MERVRARRQVEERVERHDLGKRRLELPPRLGACEEAPAARALYLAEPVERGLAVKRYRKPTNTRTAPLPLQQQIATEVNLVIEGLSD